MNFLRWANKDRTQRIRPAASGKFLSWKSSQLQIGETQPGNWWQSLLSLEELGDPAKRKKTLLLSFCKRRELRCQVFAPTFPSPPWSSWSSFYALTPCPRCEEHFSAFQIWWGKHNWHNSIGRSTIVLAWAQYYWHDFNSISMDTWPDTEKHAECPRCPCTLSLASSAMFLAKDQPYSSLFQILDL